MSKPFDETQRPKEVEPRNGEASISPRLGFSLASSQCQGTRESQRFRKFFTRLGVLHPAWLQVLAVARGKTPSDGTLEGSSPAREQPEGASSQTLVPGMRVDIGCQQAAQAKRFV
jgi:hypothetical protein